MPSYFSNLLNAIANELPLNIDEITWNDITFFMGGESWQFNSFADWVITDGQVMLKGCHDEDAETFLKQLIGVKILEIVPALDKPSYDPIFLLSNTFKIRFFSTSVIDPWTFKFEENRMFVASPSDTEWIFKQ
ncbi:MAG TPA: hypothetical protein VEY10_02730 [Flavisolibacter sp.]|jgi:hypothetical protein|nr:hypothetical protein [Flavisolibacter sp.]